MPFWQRDHGASVAHRYGRARSPEWPRVAHEHLSHEPACAVCGHRGRGLQVHHIKPFHLYPELELDPKNLITLCEIKGRTHHLLIGHLDDWESYNKRVREDAKRYSHQSATAIKANSTWQKEVSQRPMP
jgi:5-methylcytosine-specific restriction endonuclease McrA